MAEAGATVGVDDIFAGGSKMGALIRSFDWSTTPVGAVSTWSQSLKTAVRIVLGSRYPMFVWWGHSMTKFYVKRLLSQQYKVEAVADGVAALAAVRQHRPDLVLTDVMMPGLDGFELLRSLRADPHNREIPIILLSARAGEESRIEGLEAGADDYLIKPFSARELLAGVEAALKMARIRKDAEQALRQSESRFRLIVESAKDYAIFTLDRSCFAGMVRSGAALCSAARL